MKCKQCGYEIDDKLTYCPFCGTKTEKNEEIKACVSCGTPLADGALYCTNCGKPVSEMKQTEPYVPAKSTSAEQVLGILGIVFAFLSPIVGLILGIVGLVKSIHADNKSAKTLGILAIVFASVMMLVEFFLCFTFLVIFLQVIFDNIENMPGLYS